MPFNLVHISQQDPKWKDMKLGTSNLTLGAYGCAVTSLAMYLSGFNYPEDAASLNTKMRNLGGFVDAAIVWGAVSTIYPKIRYKNLILCRDTDAPIDMIGNSVSAGQPVLLEVDSSPASGLQTHWVVAYKKVGKDFLILDPFPYPSDKGEVSLMARYSQGKELKRSITAAVFYESQGEGVPSTPTTPPADGGYYVRVIQSLEAGLRLRSQPTTASDTLTIEAALTNLKVLEPEATARPKVGAQNQWLNVSDPNGLQGYVAASYVENVSTPGPVVTTPPVTTPPVTTPPSTSEYYVRVLQSVPAGLSLRSQPNTSSNTLAIEPTLTNLRVLEPEATARAKVGVQGQWLNVSDPKGLTGYVAAWYVENTTQPVVTTPPVVTPPAVTGPPKRSRRSIGEGLENVELAPAADQMLNVPDNAPPLIRLVAKIWNRYGGLLEPLSVALKIKPGTAVAVLAIESGGQAFADDGRMIIRFENHIFFQYWGRNHMTDFAQRFRFNPSQSWTGHQWRPNTNQNWIECHTSQASEWDVLNFASTLDQTAARMSISMGAPQIMGFNAGVIGYASADDMFVAFSSSERDQIIGFFDFIVGVLPNGGAVTSLQKLDYKAFATTYNGSGQADYYAGLMKTATDSFTILKSTMKPTTPVVTTPPVVTPPVDVTPPTPPTTPPPPITPPPVTTPPVTTPPSTPPVPPDPPPPYVEPPAEEPVVEEPHMEVVVNTNVVRPGLNLRQLPSTTSEILGVEPVGTKLRVLDDPDEARARIGKVGQWILVKDQKGRRGYVGAAYVVEAK